MLVHVVDDGASIGFLPPLDLAEAECYCRGVPGVNVILFVARHVADIVGTVQVHLEERANGRHRAPIAKLMVRTDARRRGLGRRLMEQAERAARDASRSLLVLDTRVGDPSNELYRSMGYVEAGRIPRWAREADGSFAPTILYYKDLR